MKPKIHHEGINIVIALAVIFSCICVITTYLSLVTGIIVSIALASIFIMIVNFFRSPVRKYCGNPTDAVIAPADGTVVALEEVYEPIWGHRVIQLSIFMSIFNVHANWYPVNGIVMSVNHQNGRYLSAYLPKASSENERSTIIIKTTGGQEIMVRQIAGAIARRIVTYATPGAQASIHEHLGFIKFGSRVDVFLPLNTSISVSMGDKTVGGITKIASL